MEQKVTTDQFQSIMIRFHRSSRIHREMAIECEKDAKLRPFATYYNSLADVDNDAYQAFAAMIEGRQDPVQSVRKSQPVNKKEKKIMNRNARVIIIITILALLFIVPSVVIAQATSPPTLESDAATEIVAPTPTPLVVLVTVVPSLPTVPVVPVVPTQPVVIDVSSVITLISVLTASGSIIYVIVRGRDFNKAQERFYKILEDKQLTEQLQHEYNKASMTTKSAIEFFESAAKILGGSNILPGQADKIVDKLSKWLEDVSEEEPDPPPEPPPTQPPLVTPSN